LIGLGLIVVHDELDRALGAGDVQSTACIHLLFPQLVGLDLRSLRSRKDRLGDREADATGSAASAASDSDAAAPSATKP
jgi:hypothetical protein